MGRPARLVEPQQADEQEGVASLPRLDVADATLPPATARFTRADAASLIVAGVLHLAVIGAFLAPERRFGGGGVDLEAIGIEIVTVAPALEARSTARGRGAAGGGAQVAEQDGGEDQAVEQTAARDSQREEKAQPQATPPPADLTVRDWQEPPPRNDAAATEPVIARAKADGETPDRPDAPQTPPAEQQQASADSASAAEVLARFKGGAAARGREETQTTAVVMAAARAGQRDAYMEAIVLAIRANPPRNDSGQSGAVKVEFRVRSDGSVGDVRVLIPSRSPALDQVAVAAMQALRLPPPPATLTPDLLGYDLVITFQ